MTDRARAALLLVAACAPPVQPPAVEVTIEEPASAPRATTELPECGRLTGDGSLGSVDLLGGRLRMKAPQGTRVMRNDFDNTRTLLEAGSDKLEVRAIDLYCVPGPSGAEATFVEHYGAKPLDKGVVELNGLSVMFTQPVKRGDAFELLEVYIAPPHGPIAWVTFFVDETLAESAGCLALSEVLARSIAPGPTPMVVERFAWSFEGWQLEMDLPPDHSATRDLRGDTLTIDVTEQVACGKAGQKYGVTLTHELITPYGRTSVKGTLLGKPIDWQEDPQGSFAAITEVPGSQQALYLYVWTWTTDPVIRQRAMALGASVIAAPPAN
jgi:hypothetical protein